MGLVRAANEDVIVVIRGAGFCLVATGMGGAAAGVKRPVSFLRKPLKMYFSQRIPAGESDGLTDMIDDRQMVETLTLGDDLGIVTGRPIDQAKRVGGKDNITVVLAQVG